MLMEPPSLNVEKLKPIPPADVMAGCDKLLSFSSTDKRAVLTTIVKNNNIYFNCASRLRGAIAFINAVTVDSNEDDDEDNP